MNITIRRSADTRELIVHWLHRDKVFMNTFWQTLWRIQGTVLAHYNTANHSGLKVLRSKPSMEEVRQLFKITYLVGSSKVEAVDEMHQRRATMLQQLLRQNLQKAQQRMANQANKHRTEMVYDVWVNGCS